MVKYLHDLFFTSLRNPNFGVKNWNLKWEEVFCQRHFFFHLLENLSGFGQAIRIWKTLVFTGLVHFIDFGSQIFQWFCFHWARLQLGTVPYVPALASLSYYCNQLQSPEPKAGSLPFLFSNKLLLGIVSFFLVPTWFKRRLKKSLVGMGKYNSLDRQGANKAERWKLLLEIDKETGYWCLELG